MSSSINAGLVICIDSILDSGVMSGGVARGRQIRGIRVAKLPAPLGVVKLLSWSTSSVPCGLRRDIWLAGRVLRTSVHVSGVLLWAKRAARNSVARGVDLPPALIEGARWPPLELPLTVNAVPFIGNLLWPSG
eukprot:TRINITY_DN72629_c0_g1_i1.p2 TRINITY_DN72629_c0_g1~~TRINITY_DN72629_c0_g1_i1.p2  ORF type:complete len:133 (+),score=6.73 TRINITY_DN72629_c0_g1_i1:130-528(+)